MAYQKKEMRDQMSYDDKYEVYHNTEDDYDSNWYQGAYEGGYQDDYTTIPDELSGLNFQTG